MNKALVKLATLLGVLFVGGVAFQYSPFLLAPGSCYFDKVAGCTFRAEYPAKGSYGITLRDIPLGAPCWARQVGEEVRLTFDEIKRDRQSGVLTKVDCP